MNVKTPTLIVLMLILAFAIVGCSDDSSPTQTQNEMTTEEREDVADDFSSALADPDAGMLSLWMSDTGAGMTASVPVKEGASPSIADTLIHQNRFLTITRIRNFYDEDGNWSEDYDPETTVAMERLFTLVGEYESRSGHRSASVDHQDSTYVDGMQPDSELRTLNGEGSRYTEASFESRFHQASTEMTTSYTWMVDDLQIATDREESPYPLSGTISVTAEVYRHSIRPIGEREMTRSTSFTVTFDGTQYALVTMEDGTEFYIDLDIGRCHRGRPGDGPE